MLYLEIILILVVVGLQLVLYVKNKQKAAALAGLFPRRWQLQARREGLSPEGEGEGSSGYMVDQLEAEGASEAFREMLEDTNTYLKKSRGSASYSLLKELSERPLELQAAAASAMLSTPLYVGLLGTFLGIALGLFGIVGAGVNETSIQTFLAGVLVAMLGSFGGLLFSLLSNFIYREARQQASERWQTYLSFVQANLLPRLEQDTAGSQSMRILLEQFTKDFFGKMSDFREAFGNLSQYISVQEKFLAALEGSGFSQLAEANLRFAEQIQENARLFESFSDYQRKLNESLQLGAGAARDIRQVVERLSQIDDVQAYIRQNEEMLRKQLGYLTTHQDKMEDLSHAIQQHFVEAGDEIGRLVRQRMQILQREEQDAGEALKDHFARLKEENVYQKIADQLQPIRQMEKEVEVFGQLSQENSRMLLQTSEYLVKKINQDGRLHQSLLEQIGELNRQVALLNEKKSWWQKLWGNEEKR